MDQVAEAIRYLADTIASVGVAIFLLGIIFLMFKDMGGKK